MTGNALLVIVSFLLGWVALWPARRALGAWDYHLAALPVGLVGWTVAAGAAGLVARPMTWPVVVPAVTAYVGVVFWVLHMRAGSHDGPAPALWTFAVAGAVVLVATLAAVASRLTIVGYDSWAHYQASAIWLADHGLPTAVTLGQDGPLIPAVIAAGRMFGGDWIYALYPVMAANLVLLTARSVHRVAARRVRSGVALAMAVLTALVLVLQRAFVTHSLYVHSQMYSALFLMLAVVPVLVVAGDEEIPHPVEGAGPSPDPILPTLVVSGLATAGLALTRPDGLVYVFVPMLLIVALRLERGWSYQRLLYYTAPLLGALAASYLPAFARLHVWRSDDKLSGRMALLSLALIVAVPVAGELLARWKKVAWLRRGHNTVRLALALDVLAVSCVAAVKTKGFATSLSNMLTNLLSTGGYGRLWPVLGGIVLVTVIFGMLRSGDSPVYTLFVMAQFFAIALVVHGLLHPGRLSPADSFNRVAFHVVPIALWYVASAVATFWPSQATGDDAA